MKLDRLLSLFLVINAEIVSEKTNDHDSVTKDADETTDRDKRRNRRLRAWVKEEYPNPEISPSECRTTSNRLCDPDGVLIDVERRKLVEQIEKLENEKGVTCGTKEEIVQVAVALANRMDLIPYGPYEDREEKAAEAFAVYLHDHWGVGVETPACGGTGVVIFFSILDRAFYISRGKALASVLTDRRIDRSMERVKILLRSERYAAAMSQLVEEINSYLDKGPPNKEELRQDMVESLFPLAFFLFAVGGICFKARSERREARTYAEVESQLSLLDRSRAEALQGRYNCTSCPICLENFEEREDGQPPRKGSDGQPLKLLRCGHVFDETCWSEWVSSGAGNVRRCPICQQDVGSSTNDTEPLLSQQQQEDEQVPEDENRVFRQFNRERNFRLARIALRYPAYIRPEQMQRWTAATYEGQLARDPSFLRNNPRYQANHRRGMGRHGGSSSFGGGSSGGGRGGSW